MVYDSASMSKAGRTDQYANLVSSKTQYLLKQSPVSKIISACYPVYASFGANYQTNE
jgi:hypothetical protein